MEGEYLDLVVSKLTGEKYFGFESALHHWSLANWINRKPQILSKTTTVEFQTYCKIKCINGWDDFVQSPESGLFYTNKERTICDMILYERCEELIFNSLDDYLYMDKIPVENLMKYARKYNVEDKLNYYISELDDFLFY